MLWFEPHTWVCSALRHAVPTHQQAKSCDAGQKQAAAEGHGASKVLELHAVSSGHDVVQPLTPCLSLFWLWVVVLPSGDFPNPQ